MMTTDRSSLLLRRAAGLGLLAALPGLLAGSCTPPKVFQARAEGVLLAYAGGGLGPRLVVRSSRDGQTWTDWGVDAPLRQIEGEARGVAMASDANSAGHRLLLGLGPAEVRSRYAVTSNLLQPNFGALWDSQVRQDTLSSSSAGVSAVSVAPFGRDGASWLLAFGEPSSDGTMKPRLVLQPTAVPDVPGNSPLADVPLPLAADERINGRPLVFARAASQVLFAYRPLPASNGRVVVRRGDALEGQRSVNWSAFGWSRTLNDGLPHHQIRELCLGGDGVSRFVLGALLVAPETGNAQTDALTHVLRLFRSSDAGASFQRVQFILRSSNNPNETFDVEYHAKGAQALGCAPLPGGAEVLMATIGTAPNGAVEMSAIRVDAGGVFTPVGAGDSAAAMFPRPPQVLPFALLALGPAQVP
jgi:hypothetical protein